MNPLSFMIKNPMYLSTSEKLYTSASEFVNKQIDAIVGDGAELTTHMEEDIRQLVVESLGSGTFKTAIGIATSILTCLFLIFLFDSVYRSKGDFDSFIRSFAVLAIEMAVVQGARPLILMLTDAAVSLIHVFTDANLKGSISDAIATLDAEDAANVTQKVNIFIAILDVAQLWTIGKLSAFIVSCVARVALITAKIELVIRTLVFPIGAALLGESGWQGNGGRWIKKWIATYLQFGIIALAFTAWGFVMSVSVGTGGGNLLVTVVAGAFATSGICLKSGQIAGDIVGV